MRSLTSAQRRSCFATVAERTANWQHGAWRSCCAMELCRVRHSFLACCPIHPHRPGTWFYKDLRGNLHGPFTNKRMDQWQKAGYFGKNLLVRKGYNGKFKKITAFGNDPWKVKNKTLRGEHKVVTGTIEHEGVEVQSGAAKGIWASQVKLRKVRRRKKKVFQRSKLNTGGLKLKKAKLRDKTIARTALDDARLKSVDTEMLQLASDMDPADSRPCQPPAAASHGSDRLQSGCACAVSDRSQPRTKGRHRPLPHGSPAGDRRQEPPRLGSQGHPWPVELRGPTLPHSHTPALPRSHAPTLPRSHGWCG